MDTATGSAREVDLHRLDLRFAEARLLEPREIRAQHRRDVVHGRDPVGHLGACQPV